MVANYKTITATAQGSRDVILNCSFLQEDDDNKLNACACARVSAMDPNLKASSYLILCLYLWNFHFWGQTKGDVPENESKK